MLCVFILKKKYPSGTNPKVLYLLLITYYFPETKNSSLEDITFSYRDYLLKLQEQINLSENKLKLFP